MDKPEIPIWVQIALAILLSVLSSISYRQGIEDSLILDYVSEESDSGKLKAARKLAEKYELNGYYYKTLEYYTESKTLENKIYGYSTAETLSGIGRAFLNLERYDSSYFYFNKSISRINSNSSISEIEILKNLQYTAIKLNDLENALKFGEKLLSRFTKSKDTMGIARQFNELGTIYQLKNEYEKGIYYFKKAYETVKENYDIPNDFIAVLLTNLGVTLGYLEEYQEATRYLRSAQEYWPEKNRPAYADSYNYLAANYLAQGQFQLALNSVEKAVELADKINSDEVLIKSFKILAFIYQVQNDLTLYQSYSNQYQEIRERIEQKKVEKQQDQLEQQAEQEKRERLIRQKMAEEERQKMALEQFYLEQEKRLQELKLAEAALVNKELENIQQKQLLEIAQQRALAEKRRAEIASQKALNESQKAEASRLKAEAEKRKAEAERQQRAKEITEIRLVEEQQKSYYFRGLLFLSILIIAVIVISYFQIRKTLLKLRKAQKQLVHSEKMASIGILSAGISHEINNPLNFINSGVIYLSNEIKEKSEKEYKELEPYIEIIRDGVSRVLNIVRSLSHFSRQSTDMNENCNIHQILSNCLAILQNATKNRIEIVKNYSEEEIVINGNEGKIHQVFLNILTNAVQAIKGQGTIKIKTKKTNKKVQINISDDGTGIPQKHLNKIFDPFFTTKNPDEGTGLGLSITYQIMQEHNGKIEIDSEEGKGTRFKLIFPVLD